MNLAPSMPHTDGMRTSHLIHCTTLLLISLLLNACGTRSPAEMLKNYAERVAHVLETDVSPLPIRIAAFPARRERVIAIADIRQGIFDVLKLKQCELLDLVGTRNSSLGKLQAPSQRLIYERRFYQALSQCLARPDTQQQKLLHQQLTSLAAQKEKNWPAQVYNALYASPEMEAHFSRSSSAIPLTPNDDYLATLRALEALSALTHKEALTDKKLKPLMASLETHYQALTRSELGAELLQSLSLTTVRLNQVAAIIELRLKNKPLCYQNKSNRRADILNNVFTLFYAGEVQPYLSQIHQLATPWFSHHQQWLKTLAIPAAMRSYYQITISADHNDSLWRQFNRAQTRHTQAWQSILRQCGLMPDGKH